MYLFTQVHAWANHNVPRCHHGLVFRFRSRATRRQGIMRATLHYVSHKFICKSYCFTHNGSVKKDIIILSLPGSPLHYKTFAINADLITCTERVTPNEAHDPSARSMQISTSTSLGTGPLSRRERPRSQTMWKQGEGCGYRHRFSQEGGATALEFFPGLIITHRTYTAFSQCSSIPDTLLRNLK